MIRGARTPRGLDLRPERLSIPSPMLLTVALDELDLRATSVRENYLWLHGVTHSMMVTEGAKRRSSSPSDPTSAAASQGKGSLLASYERVLDAHGKLKEAEALLLKALNRYDPPQIADAWSPKSVRMVELERYQEAQQRRRSRDEHIPT